MERKVGEIAVIEISPIAVATRPRSRSRSRAALSMAAAASPSKRRKVQSSDQSKFSSSNVKIRTRTRRRVMNSLEKSVDLCSSSSSSLDRDSVSCCSSNDEEIEFVDLEVKLDEVETSRDNFCTRRESTPSSELESESVDLEESMAKTLEQESRNKTTQIMPTRTELDEFFAEAERSIQKRFTEKYNFDFVNSKPLEGRYEWIKQNPEEEKHKQ